ncbi:MAG: hypothetical protein OEZ59_13320 [Deltaproteobacteria bacterium]|nr:hypothetical protein [Deltaproteobacteria bacterium]
MIFSGRMIAGYAFMGYNYVLLKLFCFGLEEIHTPDQLATRDESLSTSPSAEGETERIKKQNQTTMRV